MRGHRFTKFVPAEQNGNNKFDQLFDIFQQLLLMTSGDVSEAMSWLSELDRQYNLTNDSYGIGDFFDDLKKKGYISEEKREGESKLIMTPKAERVFVRVLWTRFSVSLKDQNQVEIIIRLIWERVMNLAAIFVNSNSAIHSTRLQ
jgi:hypothetical protein